MPPRTLRYRHIKTGIVLYRHDEGDLAWYTDKDKNQKISTVFVEGSKEWESLNPLFTTEDGVEIFPGNSWYYLVLELNGTPSSMTPKHTNTLQYNGTNVKPVARFSTIEAANKWLARHSKKLSYIELEEQANKFKLSLTSLKEIAKYLNIK